MGHGTESDIHTLQFEGNHFSYHALHRSAYPLFPGSLATLHMLADNNGRQHFDLGGLFPSQNFQPFYRMFYIFQVTGRCFAVIINILKVELKLDIQFRHVR